MESEKISVATIETWVVKAQKGHEKSFSLIYDHFFSPIFRYVSFRVPQEHTEDLVGDIFFKVVNHLPKYKPQATASFKAWLYRIAHNQVIDFYRKRKELLGEDQIEENFFVQLPDEKTPQPNKALMKDEESKKIHEVLKKLSPTHRTILELKFLEDFSNTEVAKITGKSEGNIRLMQLRALREMRKYF